MVESVHLSPGLVWSPGLNIAHMAQSDPLNIQMLMPALGNVPHQVHLWSAQPHFSLKSTLRVSSLQKSNYTVQPDRAQ